jgi:hypothetical protein
VLEKSVTDCHRVGKKCYGLSSRPELLIPEGDEKWSGGTLRFAQAAAILKMLWQKKRRKLESLRQTLSLVPAYQIQRGKPANFSDLFLAPNHGLGGNWMTQGA